MIGEGEGEGEEEGEEEGEDADDLDFEENEGDAVNEEEVDAW